jgi:hypothetical protein
LRRLIAATAPAIVSAAMMVNGSVIFPGIPLSQL